MNKEKKLIAHLGGATAVKNYIKKHTKGAYDPTLQQICSWYTNGIPLKFLIVIFHAVEDRDQFKLSQFHPELFVD